MIYSLYLENLLKSFSACTNLPLRDVLDKSTGADPKTSSISNMPRFLKQLRDANDVAKQYNVRKKLVIAVSKADKKRYASLHRAMFKGADTETGEQPNEMFLRSAMPNRAGGAFARSLCAGS